MKQLLLQYFARRRRRRSGYQLQNSLSKRVLLIPYNAIGDALMTMPTLAAINTQLPEWQLDVLAHPRSAELFAHHPAVSTIYQADVNRRWAFLREPQWPRKTYDMVLYLGSRLTFFTQLNLQQLPTPQLYSLSFSAKDISHKGLDPEPLFDALTSTDDDQRFVRRMRTITTLLGETEPEQWDQRIYLPDVKLPNVNNPMVIINPAGTQQNNRFEADTISRIASMLQSHGYEIAAFDTPDNRALITSLPIQWLPSPSLAYAKSWLERSVGVITTDTSIGHMGAALSVPTIIVRCDQQWRADCDPLWGRVKVCVSPSATDINRVRQDQLEDALTWLATQH
ncbi:MAG: glycosyltransferase family 9 protein [Pseudomonadota bacterium]|uniref:glycosyltransferase family 9 protein n=1 Tax=Gallaecimonas pentaromativorans TaxID=584787 RepID=UPI00067E788A|nr:glycosyltransferase family 9 protein [Gallaecimonas pentaromativorans]MED5526130.1 glycosyltransferase family 9 protein [Pseudomonadota bacterium]